MGISGVGKTVHAALFTAGGREGEGAGKEGREVGGKF